MIRYGVAIFVGIAALTHSISAQSQSVDEFYRGKTVTLVISTGAGGPLDLVARTIAKYMDAHLPSKPSIIVKNMPGGGHLRATNFMYNNAPKDGSYFGGVVNSIPLHQAISGKGVRFDVRKFNWIGAMKLSNLMTIAWATSGIRTIDDAMKKVVPTGASGVGSGTYLYTNAMNHVLGTKFKMILGYKNSSAIDLAVEKGEVVARGGYSLSGIKQKHPDWIKDKKINFLVQVGMEREKEYPNVPLMFELAKTTEQRKILTVLSSPAALGRPFFAPPDVPADRVAALRAGFAGTMKDPAFLKTAKRVGMDLESMDSAQVAKIVEDIVGAPADIIAKVKAILEKPKKSKKKKK